MTVRMTQQEVDEYCESVMYNPQGRGNKRRLKCGVGVNDLHHITQFTDDWVKSVKTKKMILHNLTYPVATLNRICKYKAKGYHATEVFYVSIVEAIQRGVFDGERLGLYID